MHGETRRTVSTIQDSESQADRLERRALYGRHSGRTPDDIVVSNDGGDGGVGGSPRRVDADSDEGSGNPSAADR